MVEPLDKYNISLIAILSKGMYYYSHINIKLYEINKLQFFKFNNYYQNEIKFYKLFMKSQKLDDIEIILYSNNAKDIEKIFVFLMGIHSYITKLILLINH